MTSMDINLQQLLALQPGLFQRLVQQVAVGDSTNSVPVQLAPHTTQPSSSTPPPGTSMAAALARLRVNSLMPLNLSAAKIIPDGNSDAFLFYSEYLQSLLNNSAELQQKNQQPHGNAFDGLIEQQCNQVADVQTLNRANLLSVSDGFLHLSSANTDFNPRLRLKRQNPSTLSLLSTASNDKSVSFHSEGTPSSSPISISPPFMGGSTSMSVSAPSTTLSTASSSNGSAASVDETNDALLFSAASLPTHLLNTIPSANNTLNNTTNNRIYNASQAASGDMVNNEMLVPSNDKEGWCRNKKYIQIVKKGYRCTVCNKVYGRYNSVSYHVTIYHRNPPIRCEEEGCQFTTREARYIHFHKYYRHQIPLPESIDLASRKCPLMRCKHVSKSPAMLEKHMQRHVVDCLRDGIYECAECCATNDKLPATASFKTTTYEAMYEHLRAMHTIGKIPPMSPVANSTEIMMEDTMDDTARSENEQGINDIAVNGTKQRNVKSPTNYSCSYCSYRGRTMSNLENHKLTKHNNNANLLQSKKEESMINGEIVSPVAVKSLASLNDTVMEDLTNFTNINQQQQQRQQLQRLYELQLLQQKSGLNLTGLNLADLLNNANRHAAGGLALNGPSLNIGASYGGVSSFGGIGSAGVPDGAAIMPSPLNLNFLQQIRSSPEYFMRAFEQLLIVQKSLFANLPN